MNKVVARFADGRMLKGFTADFVPAKEQFHITVADAASGSGPVAVQMKELKALLFVRDLVGNRTHRDRNQFDPARPPAGRKIKVVFRDGEVMIGTTQGYQPDRAGFFLVPADPEANTERCYVVSAATVSISFI